MIGVDEPKRRPNVQWRQDRIVDGGVSRNDKPGVAAISTVIEPIVGRSGVTPDPTWLEDQIPEVVRVREVNG
jgi:hypothetical protein